MKTGQERTGRETVDLRDFPGDVQDMLRERAIREARPGGVGDRGLRGGGGAADRGERGAGGAAGGLNLKIQNSRKKERYENRNNL